MKKMIVLPLLAIAATLCGQHITILHTNDTHSQVDPTANPENLGGVARRMVVVDSIRGAAKSPVMLVDAGDAVQGSMFFTLFGGEVEQNLLNAMDYDIQILGNHEFDNGMERLAENYRRATPVLLATNYRMDSTPLDGLFKSYLVRNVGDAKVGFMAININPEGLIDRNNWQGLVYLDAIEAANAMSWYLRNVEKVDRVVAITHIGYDDPNGMNDTILAKNTHGIDLIIGGHSHTLLDPDSSGTRFVNLDGDTVTVLQTGSKGRYLGEADLDIANGCVRAKLHRLDSSLDRGDSRMESIVKPFRHRVDSVSSIVVGRSAKAMASDSPELLNWLTDYVKIFGAEFSGINVDLAIMNKGGIRNSMPGGNVTKGTIMNMLPFDNRVVVMEISGRDLLDNFAVMARQGGNGVSRDVDVAYAPDGHVIAAEIAGKAVDPDATYTLATITYLADGGDYMVPLTRGRRVATSENCLFKDVIASFECGFLKGVRIKGDPTVRMRESR